MNLISRLKFDLSELANEMLDELPVSLFESKTTTFYDPSIGGGQFIKAVEERLKEYGHSDSNINKRVYGTAETLLDIGFARSKNELLATITTEDLTESDMKFDVPLGNPPFQTPGDKEKKARKYNLWSEFTTSWMGREPKHMAFVLPDGWTASGSPIFEEMRDFGLRKVNIGECGRHFPGIGIGFTYVILERGYRGKTIVQTTEEEFEMDFNEVPMISPNPHHWSILAKLIAPKNKQGWRRGQGYHTSSKSDWESNRGKYTVFHTNQQEFKTNQIKGDQDRKKVILPMTSGWGPRYDNGVLGVAQATVVLPVSNLKNAKSVVNSTLYTWLGNALGRQQGSLCLRLFKELGELDLSQKWDDESIYKRFKLTKKEIRIVESEIPKKFQ